MKVAQLPDGHAIEFPDDAEDEHMDAAVHGYMAARGDIPPTKMANLPNGHAIGFPADAEDAHMDAAVQGYMAARGDIPPPVDPTVQMLEAVQQGFTHALAQMERGLQRQIAEMQSQNMQREEVFLRQLDEMRQRDESTIKTIVAALTAPKRIVRDSNGRPVGVTVEN